MQIARERRNSATISPPKFSQTSKMNYSRISSKINSNFQYLNQNNIKGQTQIVIPLYNNALKQTNFIPINAAPSIKQIQNKIDNFSYSHFKSCFDNVYSDTANLQNNTCTIPEISKELTQQNLSDLSNSFNLFLNALRKDLGGPALSNGRIFSENWRFFLKKIKSIAMIGHPSFKKSIYNSLNSLDKILENVLNYINSSLKEKNDKYIADIHDKVINSYNNYKACINMIRKDAEQVSDTDDEANIKKCNSAFKEAKVEKICDNARNLMRKLNESFLKEFSQIGLRGAMQFRKDASIYCNNIIHGLIGAALFDNDLEKIECSVSKFNILLKDTNGMIGLPTDFESEIQSEEESIYENFNNITKYEENNAFSNGNDIHAIDDQILSLDDGKSTRSDYFKDINEDDNSIIPQENESLKGFLKRSKSILLKKIPDQESLILSFYKNVLIVSDKSSKNNKQNYKEVLEKLKQAEITKHNLIQSLENKEKESVSLKTTINALKEKVKTLNQQLEKENLEKLKIQELKTKEQDTENKRKSMMVQTKSMSELIEYEKLMRFIKENSGVELNTVTEYNDADLIAIFQAKISSMKDNIISLTKRALDAEKYLFNSCNDYDDVIKSFKSIIQIMDDKNTINKSYETLNGKDRTGSFSISLASLAKDALSTVVKVRSRLAAAVERTDMGDATSLTELIKKVETIKVELAVTGVKGEDLVELATKAAEGSTRHKRTLSRILNALHMITGTSRTVSDNKNENEINFIEQFDDINNIEGILFDFTEKSEKAFEDEVVKAVLQVRDNIFALAKTSENPLEIISVKLAIAEARRTLIKHTIDVLTCFKQNNRENNNEFESDDKELSHILNNYEEMEYVNGKIIAKTIENRLCDLLKIESAAYVDTQKYIFELFDIIEIKFKKYENFISDMRYKYNIPEDDNIDTLTAKIRAAQTISHREIIAIFEKAFDAAQVTSRSDPRKFLPEFARTIKSLYDSITCLKPFSTTLGEIEQKYNPSSKTEENIKLLFREISIMRATFNSLDRLKVHSIVFLVISRFLKLCSSLANLAYQT